MTTSILPYQARHNALLDYLPNDLAKIVEDYEDNNVKHKKEWTISLMKGVCREIETVGVAINKEVQKLRIDENYRKTMRWLPDRKPIRTVYERAKKQDFILNELYYKFARCVNEFKYEDEHTVYVEPPHILKIMGALRRQPTVVPNKPVRCFRCGENKRMLFAYNKARYLVCGRCRCAMCLGHIKLFTDLPIELRVAILAELRVPKNNMANIHRKFECQYPDLKYAWLLKWKRQGELAIQ